MPGITGIISLRQNRPSSETFKVMVKCMMHEPFYSSGTFADDQANVMLGWTSFKEGASDGSLVWNKRKDRCLLFSGEHFTDQIESTASRDCGQGNASYILDLYEELGVSFLEKLNGRFCGVLEDLREKKVLLFNDRYGLNRIYYHENTDAFFFSSEAKSLLKVLPETRRLDEKSLGEWLSCGCALENRTLFRGISLLPPASAWTFSADGSVKKQTYFNPSTWENQPVLKAAEFSQQLQRLFPRVLKRYTNGSRPVAMSLTGGLDGRMIIAWAKPGSQGLPCYTFNGPFRDCADVRIARKVAAACGQEHRTISVGDDFLAQFPRLAEQTVYITDGAMDVTGAAELYVNRLARQIAPVRLTGNYGSEILRRYVAFRPRALPGEIFDPDFSRLLPDTAATYSAAAAGNRLSFIAFKQVPWHHYSRLAVEQSQITLHSPFLDNDLVSLAFQAPPEAAGSPEPALRLIAEGNPCLGRIPTDRGITYPASRTANRVHLSIQEFLAKAEYAYDYGMPNWLAKMDKCLAPLQFERLFLGRQKFVHFRTWYRHRLADYVKQVLLDARSRSRPYLNGPALERMVDSHTKGVGNYTVEIHKLLSLELLHRTLLESA